MPQVPGDAASPNPMLGIMLKCISVVVFVGMQTSIKAGAQGIPAGEIVFFRSFFALVPVVIYLAWLGDLRTALTTDHLGGHVWRGVIGVTSMGFGFFALTRLPYPEWITITYGAPLLTVVFAAIFLKEVVWLYRWSAVLVGLIGIMVVTLPKLSLGSGGLADGEAIGIAAAMVSATVAAIAMIQIRRLVHTEKTATIVIYFSLTSSALAALSIFFGWVVPTWEQAGFLILAGLCGGVGQLLLTACYRYADTSTIAPFEYTSLILAIIIGYVIFDEAASGTTILGGAIVVSAGIFIIWREHRLGLERSRARRVTPPTG
ncbi:DMT family transporter [Aurantimonas coralicida]|uniref:DMT family transporter n=1 Tax=Aurantimonas coralicida TaxID=182270 RepID=UPI00165E2EA9|nr:DMT family transporter [Aurantimonas coralicida]MCC4296510.1 DMT family transporter [Aurantimonas coralicida]